MNEVFCVRSFQKHIRLLTIKCGFWHEHGKLNVNIRENKD